jgi:hypothetical protein
VWTGLETSTWDVTRLSSNGDVSFPQSWRGQIAKMLVI